MDSANTRDILSVSTLTDRIKALLEEGLALVWVEGEVSNLRRPASGHVYFTLKDAKSQIRAVIFRTSYVPRGLNRPAGFEIGDGMSIVCRGRLSVYPPRGDYQIIIDTVEPKGLGALQKAFEQLKARLEVEGLFDRSRKKSIPFLPAGIGVITSPTGAVIRDILTVTHRRFPSVNILIAPVRVQGAEAPAEIIQALGDLQLAAGIEVIILARGGGSLEDLAAFNDEGVARAIARSQIPVISAVGHETDFTIADFIADLRAATPSAAAELAVPHRAELMETVETLRLHMMSRQRRETERLRQRIAELAHRIRDPKRRLTDIRIALDDAVERMGFALNHQRAVHRQKYITMAVRLEHQHPHSRITERRLFVETLSKDLRRTWEVQVGGRSNRLASAMALIESLSPLAVLNRGYSITRRLPDGRILRQAADVNAGELIDVRLAAGSLHAVITETVKEHCDGQGKI